MSAEKMPMPECSRYCSSSLSSLLLLGSSLSYLTLVLTASGMNGALSTSSRFCGTATWILLATDSMRLPRSFCSTRCARRASHATLRTLTTPSSEYVEASTTVTVLSARMESTKARFSGERSDSRTMSILLMTRRVGLLLNRGLIEWNSLHWSEESARNVSANSVEPAHLRLDGVATLLAKVHEIQDRAAEVGERSDGLHLDRVHLLERVVEHTGRVDDLPSEVLVVHVTDEQRLGGESVLREVNSSRVLPRWHASHSLAAHRRPLG